MTEQLTIDQIAAMGRNGISRAEVRGFLGRDMTDSESMEFYKARGAAKLQKKINRQRKTPDVSNSRVERFRKKEREVELLPVEDMRRRTRLEKDTASWLRFYMPNSFPYPFCKSHHALIEGIEWAAKTGEGFADAEPRGQGKSTTARGVAVKLAATGVIRFPVLVNWKHIDAKAALELWLKTLCDNQMFAADYPEICAPFMRSTHATALKNLTWKHNGEKCGAMVDTLSKVITLPNSIGAIAARSAQGDAKGLNAMMPDGTILRPDFVLFDDSQDPDQAGNPSAVRNTIDTLENVFLGMAGPQKRLCCAFIGTVEHADDVVEYFLKRRGWKSNRVSRIMRWPDGSQGGTWEAEDGCEVRRLWADWRDIYDGDDGQKAANKFFRKNKKTMIGKMEVNWIHRFDKDKDVGPYDAAMRDWFHLGADVFARGQQNQPLKKGVDVYTLTPQLVCAKQADRAPLVVPARCEIATVGTDINPSYALTTCSIGFAPDFSADYLWYGRFTDYPLPATPEMSQTQREQTIYDALWRHGAQILAMPIQHKAWMIDGGGAQSNVAKKFRYEWNKRYPQLPVFIGYGRAGKAARINASNDKIRQRGDNWILCRAPDKDYRTDEWVLWHADYWREIQQRAWTCEPGSPGGATLPKGDHREFSEEVTREKLIAKGLVGDKMVWDFQKGPGKVDFPDAANMAYVMASILGMAPGGTVRREKAKAVYFSSRPTDRR